MPSALTLETVAAKKTSATVELAPPGHWWRPPLRGDGAQRVRGENLLKVFSGSRKRRNAADRPARHLPEGLE